MKQDTKADLNNTSKNNEPGMTLHKWIATGGKPEDYNKANKTEALRASSKHPGGKK